MSQSIINDPKSWGKSKPDPYDSLLNNAITEGEKAIRAFFATNESSLRKYAAMYVSNPTSHATMTIEIKLVP